MRAGGLRGRMGEQSIDAVERPPRLSVREFGRQLADELLSLERGLPWTFWQLTRRPGETIRRYVEWRDARITRPVRYLLVALAAAGALLWLGGFVDAFTQGFAQGFDRGPQAAPKGPLLHAAFSFVSRPETIVLLALLPALASAVEGAYRSSGINTAEAFALSTYVLAQAALLFALAVAIAGAIPATGAIGVVAGAAIPLVTLGAFPILAIRGYFRPAPRATRRAVLAYVAAVALAVVAALAVLFVREALHRI